MKVNFTSLGCPKNLVDSEKIIGALAASGAAITASIDDSDIIIVNTCGFIKPALEETEEEIKTALSHSHSGNKKVFVYGCAVNRYYRKLKEKFPAVSGWFKREEKNQLLQGIRPQSETIDTRLVTTNGFAYLKIADGCSNRCSYCTIPSIKGPFRSYDLNKLINEAIELSKLEIKEIVIIAQDTTRYGTDTHNITMLPQLIRKISCIDGIKWIRIMYAHPNSITNEIIKEIGTNEKVCKYIDLPIQHINNRILKLMNRKVDKKKIMQIFKNLKEIKGISIRTTIIVGFPTETGNEFNELLAFVNNADIDWLGVFPYYCEPGTDASQLQQVPDMVIEERYHKMLQIQQAIIRKKNKARIGKVYETLIHGKNQSCIGHTEFAAPDIDSQILIDQDNLRIGEFCNIKITGMKGCDLYGAVEYPNKKI